MRRMLLAPGSGHLHARLRSGHLCVQACFAHMRGYLDSAMTQPESQTEKKDEAFQDT